MKNTESLRNDLISITQELTDEQVLFTHTFLNGAMYNGCRKPEEVTMKESMIYQIIDSCYETNDLGLLDLVQKLLNKSCSEAKKESH